MNLFSMIQILLEWPDLRQNWSGSKVQTCNLFVLVVNPHAFWNASYVAFIIGLPYASLLLETEAMLSVNITSGIAIACFVFKIKRISFRSWAGWEGFLSV